MERSVRGLDGAAEWPAVRALIPKLEGKRVADLGCGFGWFARWAREQGAARADTDDPGIEYVIADLEQLVLPEGAFDFAYSSLALHYIADFDRLIKTVYRALVPRSQFVFTIEHPIYMAGDRPGWLRNGEGRRIWPVSGYAREGARTTDWFTKGVLKQHRKLGTTLNSLIGAGFTIRHVEEWSPTSEQVAARPELAEEVERPMMLLVAVER